MKLASYYAEGTRRFGVIAGDQVVDLAAIGKDLIDFLTTGLAGLEAARHAVRNGRVRHALTEVSLLPTIPNPSKVLGIGMNFRSFVDGLRQRGLLPAAQPRIWFSRPPRCLVGHEAAVMLPRNSTALDFEGELAVVIGRQCHGLAAQDARHVIAGYTVCNDITVRDWAAISPMLGKGFDTHVPMGPVLVTVDDIDDPHDLAITVTVNGERRQSGTTAEMISNCFELVAELSAVMTLEPGDVILTGTPAGCAIFDQPPRYLQIGDRVRVEIEGIGAIENTIVAEPMALPGAVAVTIESVASHEG